MKIAGIVAMVFAGGFVTGCFVSYLIEGAAYYRESAISGGIVAGLMALQLRKNKKSKIDG